MYGGEKYQSGAEDLFNFSEINMVNNYYKPGPATQPGKITYRIANPSFRSEEDHGYWYIYGNYMEDNAAVTADNWNGGVQTDDAMLLKMKRDMPWDAMAINEESPQKAYEAVLDNAGCSRPIRDAVDVRIVNDVSTGTATYEGATYKTLKKVADKNVICGIIDKPSDVGGWPELKSLPAPVDSDHDGIPDDWELAHGLNPDNADDRNIYDNEGYTMLENYINEKINTPTAITTVTINNKVLDCVFSLNGTLTSKASHGIIIKNGKKIINIAER